MATETAITDSHQTIKVINVTQADTPYTLSRLDCPCMITNLGATGACVVNLPTDCKGGEEINAVCLVAQDITLEPGAGGGFYASDGTAYAKQIDGLSLTGDDAGEAIRLVAVAAGDFVAINQQVVDAAAASFSELES